MKGTLKIKKHMILFVLGTLGLCLVFLGSPLFNVIPEMYGVIGTFVMIVSYFSGFIYFIIDFGRLFK